MSATYDLMLLLDTTAPAERRAEILGAVEGRVAADGEIVSRHAWGVRTLAYEIDHRTDAEYHLLQFTGAPALLDALSHSLKITDGVSRFRIIKLKPGTPEPPEVRPEAPAAPAEAAPAEAAAPAAEAAAPEAAAPAAAEVPAEAPAPEAAAPEAAPAAEASA